MVKVILCPCGFAMRAESEEELVAAAQKHARQHGMELTSEHALAMARPE